MTAIVANQIKGLIPLMDRKKVKDKFVVDGQNFLVDATGPYSAFGRTMIKHDGFTDPEYVQDFEVENQSFIFIKNAVVTYDFTNRVFIPVYTFTELTTVFPWSHTLIGGKHYFARREVGLLQYDPVTGIWSSISGGDVPTDIWACTRADGRLCVVTPVLIAWTAIDDGVDFTTSTVTGAGFQLLAILGSGEPLGILHITNGFLTFTKSGILISRLINSLSPFHHEPLSDEDDPLPINAFCLIELQDHQHAFLSENGFYHTAGKQPVQWQPLMGEYFHKTVLPALDIENNAAIVRLSYNQDRAWFAVSVANDSTPSIYEKAYVLYLPSDEWGIFNRIHSGFINIDFASGPILGFQFGYVDNTGVVYRFSDTSYDEIFKPANDWDSTIYDYHGKPVYPARYEPASIKFPTIGHFATRDEDPAIFSAPGLYNLETLVEEVISPADQLASEQAAAAGATYAFPTVAKVSAGMIQSQIAALPNQLNALDSYVEIGLFRIATDQEIDEFNSVNNLAIQMLDTAIDDTTEDWLLDYDTEVVIDWAAASGEEDWGFGAAATTAYNVRLKSTIDGYSVYQGMDKVPTLIAQENRLRLLDCDNNGINHIVRINADNAGESYHVKMIELAGFVSGRY